MIQIIFSKKISTFDILMKMNLKNIFIMKKFYLLSLFLSMAVLSFGQNKANHFIESFESPDSWSGYTTGTVTFPSGAWEFIEVYPESAGDSWDGSKACRINDDKVEASITSPAVNTVGTVSFYYHRPFGGTGTFSLQKSVGGGAFVTLTTLDYTGVTTPTLFSYNVDDASNDIRIRIMNDDNTAHLTIDYVTITDFGGTPSVETPTFDPASGTYYSAQDVTISCATAGADIYYTTDGTDPDNTSTLYTGPVNIASTTTLKAIGIDPGAVLNDSPIATGIYTIETAVQVADIATLRGGLEDGTVYELTGEAFLTYQQSYRSKKWIQDATAGIEIDDPSGKITTTYNIYDGITGIFGTLNTYNGMLQFVPVMDPGAASSTGNSVTPIVITADEFNNNHEMYESRLVKIDNLTFDDAGGTFSTGSQYPTVDHLGTGVLFRTNFYDASYIGTTIPTGAQDITGIVYEYNGTPQFTARETTDIVPHVPVIPVGSTGIIIAGLLMAAVIVVRRGKLF